MKKILVLGEKILDKFIYCKANRLAPDRPVPVLEPLHTRESPGGAANFAANLRSLFPELEVFYIHQQDLIVKTRFVEEKTNHHFLRLDENDKIEEKLTIGNLKLILQQNNLSLSDFKYFAISDYGKGFVTKELITHLSCWGKVFLDTKFILGYWSNSVFCVKINEKEWQNNVDSNIELPSCQNLIVTRGEKGSEYNGKLYQSQPTELVDSSGLGDVFHAAIVGLHLKGYTFEQSIPIANQLCGISAHKRGVNIMTPRDLEMAEAVLEAKL